MKAFTSAAAFILICLPRIALPCSLVPPSITAPIAENTGNRPLLISENLGATLTDEQGNRIAVEAWDPNAQIKGSGGRDLLIVKPTIALPPGTYSFAESTFVITSSQAPALPTLESSTLSVFAHKDDSFDTGCGGGGGSCGSFSGLTVTVQNSESPARFQAYLLTLTNEDGVAARRLVADEYASGSPQTDLRFYDSFPEFGRLGDEEICATVSIISADGELGTSADAGCYEPDVTGGCVSTRGSKNSVPVLSLLFVGLGLGFIRRRRS